MNKFIYYHGNIGEDALKSFSSYCFSNPLTGITVVFSSQGGATHIGLAFYNLLKSLNVPKEIFCFSNVDSAGMYFLLGFPEKNRHWVKETTFLMHPNEFQPNTLLPSMTKKDMLRGGDELDL